MTKTLTISEAYNIKSQVERLRNQAYETYEAPTPADPFYCNKESERLLTEANDLENRIHFLIYPKNWEKWKNCQETRNWNIANKGYLPN